MNTENMMKKLEAVRAWQKNEKVHPLTCSINSNHFPLEPVINKNRDDIHLLCLECGFEQNWIPECVFKLEEEITT